ncbi:MAG: hypothetical protein M1820_006808 [Bogoriella megaspora]|nr:MAG: hypothetical protein M1820_006808 [Bogoriella megaspora]
MKGVTFTAASLLSFVSASSIHAAHQQFHNHNALEVRGENDVCTCENQETVTVYATTYPSTATPSSEPYSGSYTEYPFTTSRVTVGVIPTPEAPPSLSSVYVEASSPAAAPSYSSPSEGESSKPAPSSYVAPPSYAAPSSYVASSSSSAAPSSPSSGSSSTGAHHTNDGKWAMTYTPYDSYGNCKSTSGVNADVASIASKGFTTVRLYAPDCNGLYNVGAACAASGLNLIPGIYIEESGIEGARPQLDELVKWSQKNNGRGWKGVEFVVVGNEAVFQGFCSANELAAFIGEVKEALKAPDCGYTGDVTTTETLETLQANAETICPVVDIVSANIHPFFNSDIDASGAGDFVASSLEQLKDVCPGGKEYYNIETGWPSSGDKNGNAKPGKDEQKTAVQSISEKAGERSVLFSFENDSWKHPGQFGVEQFWGCSGWF